MKPIHFNEVNFDAFEVNGIPALFTNARIKRNSIPKGYCAYDIRGGDETEFATIEPSILVNHTGTIVIKGKIEFEDHDFVEIEDYNFTGEEPTLELLNIPEPSFQELIDCYTERLDNYMLEIDRICQIPNNKSRPKIPTSPNYLEEVIIPVYKLLTAYMRTKRKTVKIPNPKTYKPIKEYYRIKIGLTTVGGFSVPDGEDFCIYFTPLKSALPIGERVKVENAEQLGELILSYLKNHREL